MTALPTFAGTVSPADLLAKLDAQAAELETRRAAFEARLALREASALPAGVRLGGVPFAFTYSALATPGWSSVASRGLVSTGTLPDSDSKVAVAVAHPGRFAMLSGEPSGTIGNATFRVTVYDVAANGVPSQVATATATVTVRAGYNSFVAACLGLVDVSGGAGTVYRGAVLASEANGSSTVQVLLTATLDGGALTLAIDRNDNVSSGVAVPQQGAWHRRRGFLTGLAGLLIPRLRRLSMDTGGTSWDAGYHLYERVPGSAFVHGSLSETTSVASYALDRIGDRHFLALTDAAAPGASPAVSGRVSLFSVDDASRGTLAGGLRLNTALAGNARLCALSATLAVASYSTASMYGSYAVTRAPADNTLRQAGAVNASGVMATVPVELLPFSATKMAHFARLSGWSHQLTTLSVNAGAADGVSPFAQVAQTPAFALGAGLAGAASGDTVVVAAVERLAADRLLVVSRNSTRNLTAVEVLDLA